MIKTHKKYGIQIFTDNVMTLVGVKNKIQDKLNEKPYHIK